MKLFIKPINKKIKTNKIYMSIVKQLLKGTFIRNVFTVVSGAAIAQLIGILFSPLITRIYGPESLGVLGVFVALTSIIAPIVALTYPMGIVLPKSDNEAKGLVKLSLFIGGIISVAISLILGLFGQELLTILNMEELIPFVALIPVFLLFSAVLQVTEQWVIRKKLFKVKANVSVIQSLVLNSGKVGIGLLSPLASVLIILTTLGNILNVALVALFSKIESAKGNKIKISEPEDKVSLKPLAKIYKEFPIYRAPQMFIDGVTQNLPILMLTTFFGPSAAGFYVIGNRLLSMPSQIVGKAVGDVFYPRIADAAYNNEKISNLVIKATLSLATVGLIPFGLIIIFGPWLFSFIFGADWDVAGEYARWMALWTYFKFINNPSVRTLPVISEQRFHLVFTNINIIIRVGMLFIGAYIFKSDIVAMALFSFAGVISNVILILVIIKKCKVYERAKSR